MVECECVSLNVEQWHEEAIHHLGHEALLSLRRTDGWACTSYQDVHRHNHISHKLNCPYLDNDISLISYFFNLRLLSRLSLDAFCMSGDQTPQNQIGCHNQLLASSSWGIFQLLILGLRRVTLIAGLPPRLTSFWIISSQISSDFLKFSLKFSISPQPSWHAGTIKATLV